MWRNEVVLGFIRWLRDHNDKQEPHNKVGFYGLDLYSLFESAHEVIAYLEKSDPDAAKNARKKYACFDRFAHDTQRYGYATSFGMSKSCEQEVSSQLLALLKKPIQTMPESSMEREDLFYATQNAKVVKDAEEYYRSMFTENTWNMRDRHMVETLFAVLEHLKSVHPAHTVTKAAVWAHNSHLGDASETEAGSKRGETNIGALARETFGIESTYNVGFTGYDGTVSAADSWDDPRKTKRVRPGLAESYEHLFHSVGIPNFMLHFRSNSPAVPIDKELVSKLEVPRLERAIGVIYRPDTERWSHYFDCKISKQFDTIIHMDHTSALKPLDTTSQEEPQEPETYPFGL